MNRHVFVYHFIIDGKSFLLFFSSKTQKIHKCSYLEKDKSAKAQNHFLT
jgi:hypothetical protein